METEWEIVTIEDKLLPEHSTEIKSLLEECVKTEVLSYKGDADTFFDDIPDFNKQVIEKKMSVALRKRLNKGAGQRMNVVIGENFIVRLATVKDYGLFSVGPLKVYVFGAARPSRKE